jgi:hypothetical protein
VISDHSGRVGVHCHVVGRLYIYYTMYASDAVTQSDVVPEFFIKGTLQCLCQANTQQ